MLSKSTIGSGKPDSLLEVPFLSLRFKNKAGNDRAESAPSNIRHRRSRKR